MSPTPELPFEPLGLSVHDLGQLVSECEIDHAIAPVPHTGGGSTTGYARWEKFKQHVLEAYAERRNNPLSDGTSRLSPYLHYGMISPLRIAREAAALRTPGRDKYLDEFLIWRELAYAFCYYRRDHERLAALPNWARETLAEHASDRRPVIYSWETLARGRTGDRLWDAAQRSLLIHGELHNNVRMTWGKMLLNWTSDAQSALAMMIDLNHRYALDGQDPVPSVGSSGASASSIGRFLQLDPFSGSSATVRPPNTRSGLIPTAIFSTRRDRDANHVYAWPLWVPAFPDSPALARWSTMASMLSCSRRVAVLEAEWPRAAPRRGLHLITELNTSRCVMSVSSVT